MGEDVKCIVCNGSCQSESVSETVGSKLLNNLVELKLAFSLLCKLVSSVTVTVDGRTSEHGEHNELLKLLDEFSTVSLRKGSDHKEGELGGITLLPPLSACDSCRMTLQEVLRVEREIEDLKMFQTVHVNALKRSLMLLNEKTDDVTDDGGDEDDYWKVIRRLQSRDSQSSPQGAKRSRSDEGVQTLTESTNPRRPSGRSSKRAIASKKKGKRKTLVISSLPQPQPFVDSPVLKPCSVKLARLNLNEIVETACDAQPASSNGRPIRRSKQKAYDRLRKSLVTSTYQDNEDEEGIPCAVSDQEWNANELVDDGDYCENLEHCDFPIKRENDSDEDLPREDGADDQMSWMDWSPTQVFGGDVKIEHDATRSSSTQAQKDPTNRIRYLADNLYMCDCTVIKFCQQKRQFICQEPCCGAVILGTMLNGSLFRNIGSHVDEHHHFILQTDGKTRFCPICPFETEESPKKFKLHIAYSHTEYGQKRIQKVVCEICGRQGFESIIHRHRWSHKNFLEQVDAIQAGETFPYKLKSKLRLTPHDPLYPFVFGEKPKEELRIELPGLGTKQLPRTFCVYALQRNLFIYRFTTFKFSAEERLFTCQEPGCSASFPEYDNLPVVKMKGHVHQKHVHQWIEKNKQLVRTCSICGTEIQGLASFHIHMMREHGSDGEGVEPTAICEICMKSGLESENYLRHVWTHKNRKEAAAAAKGIKNYRGDKDKIAEKLSMLPSSSFRSRSAAVKLKLQKREKQISHVKKSTKAESQKDEATPLNFLQESMYMYDCTIIMYSTEERHFVCQEPECGALISGTLLDTSNLLSSIKAHVEQQHSSSTTRNVVGIARSCPFCSFKCGDPSKLFRQHIESEHTKLKRLTSVVCEICGRSSANVRVNGWHLWTHRNSQERVEAFQAGEDLSCNLKKRLSKQSDDPLYSLVFPDGVGVAQEEMNRKKRTFPRRIKLPHRLKVSSKFDFVFCLPQNMFLYRYTIFKYSAEERHFVCQETDCSKTFPEWMDSVILMMKNHVYKTHHYRWSIVEAYSRMCPLCFKECGRLQRFHQHMLQEHHSTESEEARVLCEICIKPLSFHDDYMRHVKTHNPPEDPSKIILDSSVSGRDAVEDELIPCEICGKKYTMYILKYHHLPRHEAYENRKKFECPLCNKVFLATHGLRNHTERIHQSSDLSNRIKCSVPGCDKSFYKRDTFRINEHLQQHKGGAHWICDLCGKTFSARNSLKDHHRSVHEPKKFQCEECGKRLSRPGELRKHKEQCHSHK